MTDPQRELHERLAMPEVFVLGRLELAPAERTAAAQDSLQFLEVRGRVGEQNQEAVAVALVELQGLGVLAQGSQKSVRGVKRRLYVRGARELLNVFGADGDAVNPHAIDPLQCQLFPRPTSGWPYLGSRREHGSSFGRSAGWLAPSVGGR